MTKVELPRSIQKAISRAVRECEPEKVVLYGSRARGDNHPVSDFDLAFYGVRNLGAWHEFAADMAYEPPSLFELDVVRIEAVSPELRAAIERDGKVVYQR
ncbi:MAG: nucleotidyltransferase domain-containing protein [Fimbriimonadaceae bacterium]|nr:nucleotidyltransferase domain-containing protein [Fimbriimonadaceae bacterium]